MLMRTVPHAAARIKAWQEVLRDPEQAIWQVKQALIALGSGGLRRRWARQQHAEVRAAAGRAYGRCVCHHRRRDGTLWLAADNRVARAADLAWHSRGDSARDTYGFLLALGITCWLGYQALINIAVITAVIPFTGIPLPFLATGAQASSFR
jgi:cell division protein FtsW